MSVLLGPNIIGAPVVTSRMLLTEGYHQELMSSRRLQRSVQLSISGCKSALNITADQTGPYMDGLSGSGYASFKWVYKVPKYV